MGQIWQHDENDHWIPVELSGEAYRFNADGVEAMDDQIADDNESECRPILRRVDEAGKTPSWVLLAPPDSVVRVNGTELHLGMQVLADKDEIHFSQSGDEYAQYFFSTERPVSIQRFPDDLSKTVCPRCKFQIEPGDEAVQCPSCRTWHHQKEGRACWTYAEHCAMCDCETNLDAGLRWSPESL